MINGSLFTGIRSRERKFTMKKSEYYMFCDLLEQLKFSNVGLEDLRTIAEMPEEIQKIDTVLDGNKKVMERAREKLEREQKTVGV